MRKALIAAAVATALFAVGAFAASFTVQSEDIASGADRVEKCADLVKVDFGAITAPASGTTDWTVSSATATFTNGTNPACVGFTARLAVTTDPGGMKSSPAGGSSISSTGVAEFIDIGGTLDVGAIKNASVLVEGVALPATFVTITTP